ncbi:hypothetical protein PR048_015209 [Dryococelus australis]|uniref:Uncharacterized protein n=1 Tax=Dryococelus australis TaxID=614101 RepID=A0ABQ9HGC2_9NEOP|nr:hypothetical protein PR048_015209 [Dryococelus australis]
MCKNIPGTRTHKAMRHFDEFLGCTDDTINTTAAEGSAVIRESHLAEARQSGKSGAVRDIGEEDRRRRVIARRRRTRSYKAGNAMMGATLARMPAAMADLAQAFTESGIVMKTFKEQLLVCFLSTLLLLELDCTRILAVFDVHAEIHFLMAEALMKTLAAREETCAELTDNDVSGSLLSFMDNVNIDMFDTLNAICATRIFLTHYAETCWKTMQHSNARALLKSNQSFDLVITEIFTCKCAIGFAYKFRFPFISIDTSVGFPWTQGRVGNPGHPAYIANYFLPFSSKMTFWHRATNMLYSIMLKSGYYYFSTLPINKFLKGIFGGDIPTLENTSLVLVKIHFSITGPRPTVPNYVEVAGLQIKVPKDLPQLFALLEIMVTHKANNRLLPDRPFTISSTFTTIGTTIMTTHTPVSTKISITINTTNSTAHSNMHSTTGNTVRVCAVQSAQLVAVLIVVLIVMLIVVLIVVHVVLIAKDQSGSSQLSALIEVKKFMEEAERGVVYSSLGTVLKVQTLPPKFLSALMSAFAALPERVVMKYTGRYLPGEPDNVMTRKWLPRQDILREYVFIEQ